MLVRGVNLPEELLRAQANGELVVFAGAGVSAPAPSSLPLFGELAKKVGEGTGLDRDRDENLDHYFGRLKLRGVQVHKAVARILRQPGSQPHDLHTLLLRLFPAGPSIRLVTTNFDDHFSTILAEEFRSSVETFYAPALPLGDDFAGLVYLHGSARKDPERCVLTDEDFGRAYLANAWATRFLAAMFQRYSVLFVGYSHGDPVMNYLARGLSPGTRKPQYAFTTEHPKLAEAWKFLGVHQITYPISTGENSHVAITHCVRDWCAESSRGILEKAERIRSISQAKPPLEGEDADYLRFSLDKIETARSFFRHASNPEWISWLEKKGFFAKFFERNTRFDDFQREVGFWLIDKFFVNHSQDVFALVQRNNGRIPLEWAGNIWHRLIRRDHDEDIDSVFRSWATLLLIQPHDILSNDDWSMLLQECKFPADAVLALHLFAVITRPRLRLMEHISFLREDSSDIKVDFDLNLLRDTDHYLSDAWRKTIEPHIANYGPILTLPVLANLAAANNMMQLVGATDQDADPFRFQRQAIDHTDSPFSTILDQLVNAARDLVVHNAKLSSDALAQASDLFASKIPIVQRLAIHALGQATQPMSDEKLAWLLERDLVYRFKADVFRFLELNYPTGSEETRRQIVEVVVAGPAGKSFETISENTRLYERFNILAWLCRIAPECKHARAEMEALRRVKPEYRERERPELDFWHQEARWLGPTEGFDTQKITSQSVEHFLATKPESTESGTFDSKWDRYCASISAAASASPDWALLLLKALFSAQNLEADLWVSAVQGINNAKLNGKQWDEFLKFCESVNAAPHPFYNALANLLYHGTTREADALPDSMMETAQRIAERVWAESLQNTLVEDRRLEDWLTEAINRPGGKLAQFWLQRISSARRTAGDKWTALPDGIVENMRAIIKGSSGASAHARIIFASQLHYLFSIDPSFAEEELLPLFDWSRSPLITEQCWHGFLTWGTCLPGFTPRLLSSFNEMVRLAPSQSELIRRAIITHVTGLAFYRLDNPLSDSWLHGIILMLDEKDLVALSASFDRELNRLETHKVEAIWERWLKKYWDERGLGRPKPLVSGEARHMGGWVLSLGKHFPEGVKLVGSLQPQPRLEHIGFLNRIKSKGLTEAYPNETAELLLVYLGGPNIGVFADETLKHIWKGLVQAKAESNLLQKVREEIFRHGFDPSDWH
jgi:Domain of unknown function (DUF4020)/SIR2-like domain